MRGSSEGTGTGTSRHTAPSGAPRSRSRRLRAAALAALTVSGMLVAVGTSATAGATPTPVLEGWGYNAFGQLGNGTTNSSSTPVTTALPGGVTATALATGGYHTLAIGSDGNLYAWGDNGFGQLGDGTTNSTSTPEEITLPGGVQPTEIAAGIYDSFAVGSDGRVYAWGDNSLAELGNGTTTSSTTPVAVSLPNGLTFHGLAAGNYTTFAIGSNGTLYGWGYNDKGQLGDNTVTTPLSPITVSLPAGVQAADVAAGLHSALAVSTTGQVYAWGGNDYGQLGDGTTNDSEKPKAITLAAGVTGTKVASALYTSLAIGSNGKVYAWGYNADGEVGDGTTVNRTSPKAITLPGGASAAAISAGAYSPMVLTTSGGIDTWGQNGYGQLGNGSTTNSLTPTAVALSSGSVATILGTGCTSYHAMAVVIPAPSMTTTTLSASVPSPTYGQGETITATVTGSDGAGTVKFTADSSTLAGCGAVALTPAGSNYQAQCTTSSLSAGNHSLGGGYSGDNNALSSPASPLPVDVAAAPLTVTASSAASVYGSGTPAVTPSYGGFVNGDNTSNLTSPAVCTTAVTAATGVGTYPSTCSGASDSNYAITYAAGSIMVGPAPLSVAAASGTMIYGSAPPSITPTVTGLQNSDQTSDLTGLSCSTAATALSPVGTYGTSCSGAADPNYTISYTAGQMIVGAAPLVVTASSLSTTYGSEPTAVTPSYSGFLNGDTSASLTTQPTCVTSASAASPVGTYGTSCSGAADPNYSITYVAGSVTVSPAPVVITASSAYMVYGSGVPAVTPSVSGLQNGEGASVLGAGLQCTTTATSSSAVGNYPAVCSGAADPNYDVTYVGGTVSVTPAAVTITASSGSMTYGENAPAVTPSVVGLQNGEEASVLAGLSCSTDASATSPVGTYDSSCSGATEANYTISYVDGSVTISPAPLTLTASSGSMTYGGTPPVITPSADGLQNGETVSVLGAGLDCGTDAVSSSPVGNYASVCAGESDPNYLITSVDGSVTVNPAPLTVTASSAPSTYGSTPPAITPSYNGFVNGDDTSSLTTPATCSTTATSSSPVGTYDSSCSGAVDANYTISYVDGAVVIGPQVLIVVASPGDMTYGGAPPLITPTYEGFVNGDNASSLTTQATCSTTATSSSPVGSYGSSCSGAVDANYTISYVDGTVSVTPASVTVTASSGSSTYGAAPPTITPAVSGLENGDPVGDLTGLVCSTAANASSPVGTYDSTCSGAADNNYSIGYVDGSVQVTAAPLVVAASSGTSTYGANPPAITPSYSGFVNGDGPGSLNTAPTCSTTATANSPVGTYPSTCSGGSDPDYAISYVPGQVVVGAAALVITASSGTMTYGGTLPTVSPSYAGFVNGDGPGSLTHAPTCSTVATSSSPVGAYSTSCSGAVDANYTISYVNGSVHISPAPLTITASSSSITYGSSAPAVQATVTGLVNGEAKSALGAGLVCSTTAGPSSPVGTYASTCSGAVDANYAISYANGSVHVGPTTLTVTANNQTKIFGVAVPTLTATITGFVDGQTLATSGVTGTAACTTTATMTSPNGTYPITCSAGTLHASNYTFTFVAGTLTIGYTSTLCDVIGAVTVNSGQSVLIGPGCWVLGTVTVKPGGALDSEGALLLGAFTANGAAALRICNTSVALILSGTGSAGPTTVGDGTTACGGSTLIGGVSLSSNSGPVSLQRACAVGILLVKSNTGSVTVINNSVIGDLTVTGNTGTVVDRPNSVIGLADLQ